MAKKQPEIDDVEATIDELVKHYSKAELKAMGGRESLRKAAAQLVTIRAQYTDVKIPVGRADQPKGPLADEHKRVRAGLATQNKTALMATANELINMIEALDDELAAVKKELEIANERLTFTEGYTEDRRLNILAEILKTGQRKASDLTQRYTILLETNNPNLLDLGKLPYDSILEVTFNLSDQKVKS